MMCSPWANGVQQHRDGVESITRQGNLCKGSAKANRCHSHTSFGALFVQPETLCNPCYDMKKLTITLRIWTWPVFITGNVMAEAVDLVSTYVK